jgi:hypothetical protein
MSNQACRCMVPPAALRRGRNHTTAVEISHSSRESTLARGRIRSISRLTLARPPVPAARRGQVPRAACTGLVQPPYTMQGTGIAIGSLSGRSCCPPLVGLLLSDPAPMLALAAIVLAGTVTSQAAALPQRGWSRADLVSRISLLEHTFLTRTEEMDSTFNAKQQQLRAAFGRESAALRRELTREVSWLRAAIDASDPGGSAGGQERTELQQERPLPDVAASWRTRRLQDVGKVNSLCSSTIQATAALRTMQNVCCAQRGESCSSSHYPTSCDHGPECGLVVHAVNRLCAPFLQTSLISATLRPLQQAATLCAATSPPDTMAVHTLSAGSPGGISSEVPHACFSTLRTQTGGQYRNGWKEMAVLHAPLGFQIKLTWRAFDLGDGDFIEIYENHTALQTRVRAQRLEGRHIPAPFMSESNIMVVTFITNKDGTAFGGSADITCVCAHCSNPQAGACRDSTGAAAQELCGEHGSCSSATGKCVCRDGFSGDYCTTPDPIRLCGPAQWPARLQRVQHACPVRAASQQAGGHRRIQGANACSSVSVRMSKVNKECCNQPIEDCSTGFPSNCNANCAAVLLPFKQDCAPQLPAHINSMLDTVAHLCAAPATSGVQVFLPDTCPSMQCVHEMSNFLVDCRRMLPLHADDISERRASALNQDCQELAAATESSDGCTCSVCAGSAGQMESCAAARQAGEDTAIACTRLDLCVPWQAAQPCNCTATDISAQVYPVSGAEPACCRGEWASAKTVSERTTAGAQVHIDDEPLIRTD